MSRRFDNTLTNEYLRNDSWTALSAYPFTWACWHYPIGNLGLPQTQMWIGDSTTTWPFLATQLQGNVASDPLRFAAIADVTGVSANAQTANGMTENVWNHVVGIGISATSRIAVLNGNWASRGTNTTSRPFPTVNSITLGMRGDSTPATPMTGRLAEVAIWDIDLSQTEVERLYNGRLNAFSVRPDHLVFYAPLYRDLMDYMSGTLLVQGANLTAYEPHPPVSAFMPPIFQAHDPAGAVALTLNAVGIASAEAFGIPTLSPGNVNLNPAGVQTQESFGFISAEAGNTNLEPDGILTAEAFGTIDLSPGNTNANVLGHPSEEAFGTINANAVVDIDLAGIPSAEAFGTINAVAGFTLNPIGITTEEVFGTLSFNTAVDLTPTGHPSEEAFGTVSVEGAGQIDAIGISSAELFGTISAEASINIIPTGILSGENFGDLTFDTTVDINPVGIVSAEALGTIDLLTGSNIVMTGIPSAETFGITSLTPGAISFNVLGIPSGEAFGDISAEATNDLDMTGIPSAEAFGQLDFNTIVSLFPQSILTGEAFGVMNVFLDQQLRPVGIGTQEAFGTIDIIQSDDKTIFTIGIPSEEAFGNIFALKLLSDLPADAIISLEHNTVLVLDKDDFKRLL